jgi:hypothetical protein
LCRKHSLSASVRNRHISDDLERLVQNARGSAFEYARHSRVADIDADTESNPLVFRIGGLDFLDTDLKLHSGSNRSDRAWKLRQKPVTGILDDAAPVFGDCGRHVLGERRFQFGVRGLFVVVHEPRIARHVSSQYR